VAAKASVQSPLPKAPIKYPPAPPPARRCRAEFRRIWLYLFVRPRRLRLATLNNFNLKGGILEIPKTRPALDAGPFSKLGTKWRRHLPCTLITASGDFAGADSQDHRQIRPSVCWRRQTVETVVREHSERCLEDDGLRHQSGHLRPRLSLHGVQRTDRVRIVVGDGHRAPDEP